jgi:hypothetical protein
VTEGQEFSRFLGRPVSTLEVFTVKRELAFLLWQQEQYKRISAKSSIRMLREREQ